MTFAIPEPFQKLMMDCPENGTRCYEDTPDLVMGHMTEFHGWTVTEAEGAVENWMNDFEQDEEGYPLQVCDNRHHDAIFRIGDECPECAAEDAAYERSKENKPNGKM